MGWFKKLTGISTPQVVKSVGDVVINDIAKPATQIAVAAVAAPISVTASLVSGDGAKSGLKDAFKIGAKVENAVFDVAKVGLSSAVALPFGSIKATTGGSASEMIAELPGSKDEAEKVAIAAAVIGTGVAVSGATGVGGIFGGTSAPAVAGAELSTVAGSVSGAGAAAALTGGASAAVVAPVAPVASTAATIGAIAKTTATVAGAASTVAQAAKSVNTAANAGTALANQYSTAITEQRESGEGIVLVAMVGIAAAFFL